MATITAQANGNWSSTSTWDLGRLPQAGDDVNLSSYAVVWDTGITTIPATGSLNSLTDTTGKLTWNSPDFSSDCVLNCTTITAVGTSLIYQTGSSSSRKLTINADALFGGSTNGAEGIHAHGDCTLVLYIRLVQGGTTTSTRGIMLWGNTTLYVYGFPGAQVCGDITTWPGGAGVENNGANPSYFYNCTIVGGNRVEGVTHTYSGRSTFYNCNIIDGSFQAIGGFASTFIWGPNNYWKMRDGTLLFMGGRDRKRRVTYGGR